MKHSTNTTDVYLEVGKKRTFAAALHWPGWCRSGRDEAAALQALVDYGPRYARVLGSTTLEFLAPSDPDALVVVERLEGNSTTDFGAPDVAPSTDTMPIDAAELRRLQAVLTASWQALDAAVSAAAGKELRKGPRGGGRDTNGIVQHIVNAEQSYLARLAWKVEKRDEDDSEATANRIHEAVLRALEASTRGDLPDRGPRGGVLWLPRYFVRRVAWHVLDHVWEIEDRAV
jgi:hypothetical protein